MCCRAGGGPAGPSAQRHFNGWHDERVESEHGDPLSSIGARQHREGMGSWVGDRGHWGEDRWHRGTGMLAVGR